MRVWNCSKMRSRCGWYHSRTRRICPAQARPGSPSVGQQVEQLAEVAFAPGGHLVAAQRAHLAVRRRRAPRPRRARSPGPCPAAAAARGTPPGCCADCRPSAAPRCMSFTCAASRNFRPPYFTNGILRRDQLDLEQVAVAGGAEQHRLPAQQRPGLAPLQHLRRDVLGLRLQVVGRHVARQRAGAARRRAGACDAGAAPRPSARSTHRAPTASSGSSGRA